MTMMMAFMQRMVELPLQLKTPSTSRSFAVPSYPFTPGPGRDTPPFTADHSFANPHPLVSPPYDEGDTSY